MYDISIHIWFLIKNTTDVFVCSIVKESPVALNKNTYVGLGYTSYYELALKKPNLYNSFTTSNGNYRTS